MKKIWAVCLATMALAACQTKPTTGQFNPERKMEVVTPTIEPIQVTAETVVIDARSRFDYSVAHVPKSINLQWSDFTEPEENQRGLLQKDLFAAARRLARVGIGPATPVVVLGAGPDGGGEEGRIAWMLAYLGVKKVDFVSLGSFRANMTNTVEEEKPKAAPMWKPEPVESLNVAREEVLFAINKRGTHQPVSYKDGPETLYKIIDVRGEKDYLGKEGFGARKTVPNIDAVNIPWKEFFDKGLRPNPEMARKLASVGFDPSQRIIVMDNNGVASAAVTLALRQLGFPGAGNYAGGLQDLMSSYRR